MKSTSKSEEHWTTNAAELKAHLARHVKKMVKRSLAKHYEGYYTLTVVDREADDAIWAGIADHKELLGDEQLEAIVRQAWREFRRDLRFGWGAEVNQIIDRIFVFGTAEQRSDAGIAISRTSAEGVGPSPEGEKQLREIAESLDVENALPPHIHAQMSNIRSDRNFDRNLLARLQNLLTKKVMLGAPTIVRFAAVVVLAASEPRRPCRRAFP